MLLSHSELKNGYDDKRGNTSKNWVYENKINRIVYGLERKSNINS